MNSASLHLAEFVVTEEDDMSRRWNTFRMVVVAALLIVAASGTFVWNGGG